MRGRFVLVAVALLFAVASTLTAQPGQPPANQPAAAPGGPPNAPPANAPQPLDPNTAAARLDAILDSWHAQNANLQTMYALFGSEKTYNNIDGRKKRFQGTAKFYKMPDGVFGANIRQDEFMVQPGAAGQPAKLVPKPDCYEQFIYSGAALYMFDPAMKELTFQTIQPPPPGQKPEDGPMPFSIFLLSKDAAKKRFDLRVASIDANYTYIEARPKFPADQQEFTFARFTVSNQDLPVTRTVNGQTQRFIAIPKNMLRQIYWIEPNKAEIVWNIDWMVPNSPDVKRQDVAQPALPQGWKLTKYDPKQPAPNKPGQAAIGMPVNRVVRP